MRPNHDTLRAIRKWNDGPTFPRGMAASTKNVDTLAAALAHLETVTVDDIDAAVAKLSQEGKLEISGIAVNSGEEI